MAAPAFLLIASYMALLMLLARPLGKGLARLVDDRPLPGLAGAERVLWRFSGVAHEGLSWQR